MRKKNNRKVLCPCIFIRASVSLVLCQHWISHGSKHNTSARCLREHRRELSKHISESCSANRSNLIPYETFQLNAAVFAQSFLVLCPCRIKRASKANFVMCEPEYSLNLLHPKHAFYTFFFLKGAYSIAFFFLFAIWHCLLLAKACCCKVRINDNLIANPTFPRVSWTTLL